MPKKKQKTSQTSSSSSSSSMNPFELALKSGKPEQLVQFLNGLKSTRLSVLDCRLIQTAGAMLELTSHKESLVIQTNLMNAQVANVDLGSVYLPTHLLLRVLGYASVRKQILMETINRSFKKILVQHPATLSILNRSLVPFPINISNNGEFAKVIKHPRYKNCTALAFPTIQLTKTGLQAISKNLKFLTDIDFRLLGGTPKFELLSDRKLMPNPTRIKKITMAFENPLYFQNGEYPNIRNLVVACKGLTTFHIWKRYDFYLEPSWLGSNYESVMPNIEQGLKALARRAPQLRHIGLRFLTFRLQASSEVPFARVLPCLKDLEQIEVLSVDLTFEMANSDVWSTLADANLPKLRILVLYNSNARPLSLEAIRAMKSIETLKEIHILTNRFKSIQPNSNIHDFNPAYFQTIQAKKECFAEGSIKVSLKSQLSATNYRYW